MPGADHILSKGILLDSAAGAVVLGQPLILEAGTGTAGDQPARVTVPGGAHVLCIGLAGENVDAVKVATGKAMVNVNVIGIAKAVAGAAITIFAKVANGGTGNAQVVTATTGNPVLGIAMEAAAAQGDIIDVLLTPGGWA